MGKQQRCELCTNYKIADLVNALRILQQHCVGRIPYEIDEAVNHALGRAEFPHPCPHRLGAHLCHPRMIVKELENGRLMLNTVGDICAECGEFIGSKMK